MNLPFAVLVLEREPLSWQGLPSAVLTWLHAAGGFAAAALAIWLLAVLLQPSRAPGGGRLGSSLLTVLVVGVLLALLPHGLARLWDAQGWSAGPNAGLGGEAWYEQLSPAQRYLADFVLGCAVAGALLPVCLNLPRLRFRRIWALARLSFKEAVRRRVLWGFSALLLVFLFASWFLPYKPEDQVRNYVRVVYWSMTPLLLVTAGLLAAFSIPNDLRSQTMYTIVTKPVERFEIVLGRCLGFILLMSLVLVVMAVLSLGYIFRGLDPEAREESYKARVPVFGDLTIMEGKTPAKGISVGREWEYRSYITGGTSNERAVWTFPAVPRDLADREAVRCEFAFDIFRTTKGKENRGVLCTFVFEGRNWDPGLRNDYLRESTRLREQAGGRDLDSEDLARLHNGLAEKYGYYELPSKEISDYHTLAVDVPAGLFKNLRDHPARGPEAGPDLQVSVRCESPTQYLGVAKHDLYLLDVERPFETNFLKGALGLWFRLCLVIVMAVTLSTYLSGIIAFLAAMFLYGTGLLTEFIQGVAEAKLQGGGPMESMLRLSRGVNLVADLDDSPVTRVFQGTDKVFQFILRRFLNLIPDVDRFDLTNYVAQGFDISAGLLVIDNLVPLLGYLLPWIILAYFLIRSREVAA